MVAKSFNLEFEGYFLEHEINELDSGSGIYCVYACIYDNQINEYLIDDLLYIGKAKNIRSRVSNHKQKNDWIRELVEGEELCFNFALIQSSADRKRVEAAMIYQHKPVCNDHYVNSFPFDSTSIQTKGDGSMLDSSFTVKRSD